MHRLAAVTNIELQIIFGLPGDTPAGFRDTLDYALSLPAAVPELFGAMQRADRCDGSLKPLAWIVHRHVA